MRPAQYLSTAGLADSDSKSIGEIVIVEVEATYLELEEIEGVSI